MTSSKESKLWAALVFIAGMFELRGLKRKEGDDTLSEYTWSKTSKPVVRGLVCALVGWLPYHFSYGNGVPLSAWDLVFAGGGAALGVLSAVRKRQ
jgi:hypothetical protein